MPGEIGTAYVAVKLDPTGIRQGMAATEAEATKRSGAAGKAAGKAFSVGMKAGMIGLAAIGVGAVKAVQAASDLNEEINKSQVVFGKSAKSILAWSEDSATAMGLSQQEALSAAGAYGNMFKTIGVGNAEAATMSERMSQLAGDMASFHNQDPTDMLDKLRSGLAGEAEPLRRFGVLLSENAVNAFAYRTGIAKTGKTLTEQQKVQARYGLILEQTKKAQGDFARTSDGLANKQRIARAQFKNLSATLGKALLPAVTDLMGAASSLAGVMTEHATATKIVIGVTAGLSAALIAANVAWKIYTAATTEGTLANYAFSVSARVLTASMLGIPVFAIVAALIALGVAFVILYRRSETFRTIVNSVFSWFKSAVSAVLSFVRENWQTLVALLLGPVALAAKLIFDHWDAIKSAARNTWNAVADAVRNGWNGVIRFLTGLPGRALQLGKDVGSAIVDGIVSAFTGIADRLKSMIPSPGDLLSGVAGAIPGVSAVTSAAMAGPMAAPAGAGVSALAGGGGGGLAGAPPVGRALRVGLARLRPSVQPAPSRVALTVTNWEDGTGYMESVSDRSVQRAGNLTRQTARMRRRT